MRAGGRALTGFARAKMRSLRAPSALAGGHEGARIGRLASGADA
jgi:hypothetical protein